MQVWREHFASRLTIWRSGLAFIVGATLTSQTLFSSLGFNPTDDGWILVCGRRLVDLQVPYRDFITVHTVGSCFLSAANCLEYAHRFFNCEFAICAAISSFRCERIAGVSIWLKVWANFVESAFQNKLHKQKIQATYFNDRSHSANCETA